MNILKPFVLADGKDSAHFLQDCNTGETPKIEDKW